MSTLIEKIPSDELKMIDDYRRMFAPSQYGNSVQHWTPIENVLRIWSEAKDLNLIKLFDGKLTISKPITYEKSNSELVNQISAMTDCYCRMGREGRNGYQFYRAWNRWVCDNSYIDLGISAENWYNLRNLMGFGTLASNRYDGPTFDIHLEGGKRISIQNGAKALKILGKIAEAFDIAGFEDFRICHSQILNDKKVKGELYLSIHPMDYMTMSDNACGWESCMAWTHDGGYRQGTVEMMNSPTVIVAYMKSDKEDYTIDDITWNNKKWRQLYVVDKDAIVAVKDYPYHNDYLNKFIIDWLCDLAKERLGWTYEEPICIDADYEIEQNERNFHLELDCGNMYNDFGAMDEHWVAIGTEAYKRIGPRSSFLNITYSGDSQCMACGHTDPELCNENHLTCMDCQEIRRCDECGGIIGGDPCWLGDQCLCHWCYDSLARTCDVCGEEGDVREFEYIVHVIPRYTHEDHLKNADDLINAWDFNWYTLSEEEVLNDYFVIDEINNRFDKYFCSKECFEDWRKDNMVKGSTLQEIYFRNGIKEYAIYYDDLTRAAQNKILLNKTPEEFKYWCSCGGAKIAIEGIKPVEESTTPSVVSPVEVPIIPW